MTFRAWGANDFTLNEKKKRRANHDVENRKESWGRGETEKSPEGHWLPATHKYSGGPQTKTKIHGKSTIAQIGKKTSIRQSRGK